MFIASFWAFFYSCLRYETIIILLKYKTLFLWIHRSIFMDFRSLFSHLLYDSNGASWFGSLVNIGGMFGCPLAGCLMDRFGRRSTLLYGLWPFLLGYAMISQGATDDRLLYVGRLLSGVGMG